VTPFMAAADRLRGLAIARGDEAAVVQSGVVTTWAALDALADDAAGLVLGAGVAPGEVVAFEAPATVATIARLLGVLRAGAVVAPMATGLTAAERAAVLDVVQPRLVLDREPTPGAGAPAIASARTAAQPLIAPPVPDMLPAPDAPAAIVMTSGTTARPKGVVLSAVALATSADAWLAVLPPATGWVLALGLGHVAGLGVVWRALSAGVPVRVVSPGDPGAMLAALRDDDMPQLPPPSHVSLIPAQLLRLLDLVVDGPPPPTLRAVPLGGGTIPAALVRRAVAAGWPVAPTYGLSEMGSGATALPVGEAAVAPGAAGRPLPGVMLSIVDPDADGVGEIVVAGPALFSGYAGEPPRTPGQPFRTGDLGRLDDAGRLVVVDRRTDRIVRGGENIAPAEVEAVLMEHPAVEEAVVVARADAALGHVPVAAIVLRGGRPDPGDPALASHVRASLAGFKVPAAFVRLDALPRGGSGKLRRAAVRALLDGERSGELARPGGDRIGWRVTGDGPRHLVLLHGTLSNAAQLDRLAATLADGLGSTVHAIDRRGSGTGRLGSPAPLDVAVHVADLVAYLDARGLARVDLVGVSFGGALALETAARHPERARAVVAYEPPYGPLADDATRAEFLRVADATVAAHRERGAAGAAETFLRGVAGDAAWERLGPRSRAYLEREGDGALADGTLGGLRPDGLASIAVPVLVLTGGASEPFYVPIAEALVRRIPGARRATLDGLAHPAAITAPRPVADAIRAFLEPIA
jgi:o-succinylbenzoate---CoA ligase